MSILLMNERTGTGATTPEWARCFNAVVGQYVARANVPQLKLVDFAGYLCPRAARAGRRRRAASACTRRATTST
ncbi:hypothetical protein WKI68_26245 [Streptomyces sp. MS1.HAVA.3]|uniref:Uncharacterized protein n=1 Tax=Streptomyces caledonius TaxID=3134107 RepID=A0ABU8U8R9_9ACTN